jgi:hypothetical protein
MIWTRQTDPICVEAIPVLLDRLDASARMAVHWLGGPCHAAS